MTVMNKLKLYKNKKIMYNIPR